MYERRYALPLDMPAMAGRVHSVSYAILLCSIFVVMKKTASRNMAGSNYTCYACAFYTTLSSSCRKHLLHMLHTLPTSPWPGSHACWLGTQPSC